MFVSCNPTVPKKWPRPKMFYDFYVFKNTRKTLHTYRVLPVSVKTRCFHQIYNIYEDNLTISILIAKRWIFLRFTNKYSFLKINNEILKKVLKTRPTYPTFFQHVTGNKHLFLWLILNVYDLLPLPFNNTLTSGLLNYLLF